MEESRKQKIPVLLSRAAHRGEGLAVRAQEAVSGGYNPGNMNTGTYHSVLLVELQDEIPVDGGPLFLCPLLPHTVACRTVLFSQSCGPLLFRKLQGLSPVC